ncbi:MAG: hypothetical protein RL013_984 [Bacteroidota bacterium]|jgi:uncharacterized membrane protein YedE/YeeE
MIQFLSQPWPWYIAGVLIGLTVPALLLLGNKIFGISSNLRHICAACFPAGIPFFKYNWKRELWNLFFVGGVVIGGIIASTVLADNSPMVIGETTKASLGQMGVRDFSGLMPSDLFGTAHILSLKGLFFMVVGGLLVGFGTRYAGGCTSGHAISGLASLQWPSLVATICFMAGGFIGTWVLLPLIFKII